MKKSHLIIIFLGISAILAALSLFILMVIFQSNFNFFAYYIFLFILWAVGIGIVREQLRSSKFPEACNHCGAIFSSTVEICPSCGKGRTEV